ATNLEAVGRLRERKRRVDKPFAIMVRDLETATRFCHVSEVEAQLLSSSRRPIVLLERRVDTTIAGEVAPRITRLGLMLPYTPLHHLLFQPGSGTRLEALVMTSGNLSEEPLARENDEAFVRLASLADYFLVHDRPIHLCCDDSVTHVFEGKETIVRRSRGYAPLPISLDFELNPVLALGAELKNTFCVATGNQGFLSQHIGDLTNQETLDLFTASIDYALKMFSLDPRVIAHDLHPDYLSTHYALSHAQSSGLNKTPYISGVQHHHAHIASCMAENGLREKVIGVAFDGTGYGSDGTIWGGEFLVADYLEFDRVAHLKPLPMPGGDAAVRKPYRMALGYLFASYGNDLPNFDFLDKLDPFEVELIRAQWVRNVNSPLTSSCGRLFDAVSALLGIRREVNYEGQAAIELEMAAGRSSSEPYRFVVSDGSPLIIDHSPVIRAIVDDLSRGTDREVIAANFHAGVAEMIAITCQLLRQSLGLNRVCLSGGVFQNRLLLSLTLAGLRRENFETYIQHTVPCNDGGIALGQAVIASEKMRHGIA
ncbi:MAG: carbamoyltransferase HypF, partial [Dehalococcoidia bacterium]|nr:carbamoyltransferase HypF [Dehalococcoidia bacterium]